MKNLSANSRISIVGCGPGNPDFLPPVAYNAIFSANVVAGAPRLLEDFAAAHHEKIAVRTDIPAALNAISQRFSEGKKIAVLVTGDPGLCSFARPVIRHFGTASCRVIPGISSVHAAFAAIGEDWYGAQILSAHDSPPSLSPEKLAEETKIAILAGNPKAADWIESLATFLAPTHTIFACENLTLPDESVRSLETLCFATLASRCILLFLKKEIYK